MSRYWNYDDDTERVKLPDIVPWFETDQLDLKSLHMIKYENNRSVDLSTIPTDVLTNLIIPHLSVHEIYQVLTTCRHLAHLLPTYRTMNLSLEPFQPKTEFTTEWFYPHAHKWKTFITCPLHREYFLQILGLPPISSLPSLSPNQSMRKISIRVGIDDLLSNFSLIQQYAPYISTMELINSSAHQEYCFHFLPVIINNPTAEYLSRWKNSRAFKLSPFTLKNLHKRLADDLRLINEQEAKLDAVDLPHCQSLSQVRGIRRVFVSNHHYDNGKMELFVEYGNEDDYLQCIGMFKIFETDLGPVRGVPEVVLRLCNNFVDCEPLSQSASVTISSCEKIRNVAYLEKVASLTLDSFKGSVNGLGNVPKLTMSLCIHHPVPTGTNQEWSFEDMRVESFAGFERLHKFTLINFNKVGNLNPLGGIRFLTFKEMGKFPKPTGKYQEWTLHNCNLEGKNMDTFAGLYKLTLSECNDEYSLKGLRDIHTIVIRSGHIPRINKFTNIQYLNIKNCSLDSIGKLVNVNHIEIYDERGFSLRKNKTSFTKETNLRSLRMRNCGKYTEGGKPYFAIEPEALRNLRLLHIDDVGERIEVDLIMKHYHPNQMDLWINRCDGIYDLRWDYPPRKLVVAKALSVKPPCLNNFTLRSAIGMWFQNRALALLIYGNIAKWDVKNVTDMSYLFANRNFFDDPIGDWDVSNVTNMDFMFYNAYEFNQPIDNWNVGNVESMKCTFRYKQSFHSSLFEKWNVSKVKNINDVFVRSTYNDQLFSWGSVSV